jgi:hypothetical protein
MQWACKPRLWRRGLQRCSWRAAVGRRVAAHDAIASEPTLWLIKIVREVVGKLFQRHRGQIQESWGSMLDKEEAVSHLVCDCLRKEIIASEARDIGKIAVLAITRARTGAKVRWKRMATIAQSV